MNGIFKSIVLADLLGRAPSLKNEAGWEPYFTGIDVRWLYETPGDGPAAALLRYQRGARAPRHEHVGHEHVLVLDGSQADHAGHYAAGTLIINPPGSVHEVVSDSGCVVLIIWERRVRFLAESAAPKTS